MTDFHVILKKKTTFDVADFPYATALSMSGSNYSVTYYSDAAHTGSATTTTYASADYLLYVVSKQ